MRKKLIAGNWKLNGSKEMVSRLVGGLTSQMVEQSDREVAVCPPFVYLDQVSTLLRDSHIRLGAQDLSQYREGAYTGEVSGLMLAEFQIDYVIVGHSERRAYFGETDEVVAEKFKVAVDAGLCPILCVGETLEQRKAGEAEGVIDRQIDAVVKKVGAETVCQAVIAYEPIWAIGTGQTASPEQAQAMHAFIRGRLQGSGADADQCRLLYGGSVKPSNASTLFSMPDIDGGLIGGASLTLEDFCAICNA